MTANQADDTVTVLLGNGDGTFQPPVAYATDEDPHSVAVADLDLDGVADVVTANRFGDNVSVLLGIGDGTFQGRVDYDVGDSPRWVSTRRPEPGPGA